MRLFNWMDKEVANVAVLEPETAVTPEPELPVPASVIVRNLSGMEEDERTAYLELADSLGMQDVVAVANEKVRAFLIEENIRIYDGAQMFEYLNQQLGEDEWEWKGLRQKDADEFKGWSARHGDGRVPYGSTVYREAIPYPVLLTVKTIADRFPDYSFHVSARKDEKGDPFIIMSKKGAGTFVIERWDEPGYRER